MRFAVVACLLIATAAPALGQSQYGERYTEPTEPIVVTGVRIQDYRDRLAACLARNCAPDEDIDATLALAEALLLDGDYGDAREAVRDSLRRNRDEAGRYPEPVSDLYRADARLSRHLGFDNAALRSARGILESLQEGIAREDHRHFTARFELAEMQLLSGRYESARRELDRLVRVAREAGREDVAMLAELRALLYEHLYDPRGRARGRLAELANMTDPARRLQAVGAKVLLARIYRAEGDDARADALLAEIGRGSSAQRRLLFAPRYELRTDARRFDGMPDLEDLIRSGSTTNRLPENHERKWVDVGFWVMPDGSVSGLEVVRQGAPTGWAAPLLESIRGRRYSTGEEPTYRLERYTYTAAWEQGTGTRIAQRSPSVRVEYLDLTVSDPSPPPARQP